MVPVIHAMTESADEALWKAAEVARAFPDVAMLVLDAFSTFEGTREAFVIAERCPNLLWDTSLSYNFDFLEQFAQQLGAERVVFGTDLYSPPLGRRISHLVPQILESSLTDDDKAKILGGNARQLFGLEPHLRRASPTRRRTGRQRAVAERSGAEGAKSGITGRRWRLSRSG